MTDIINKKQNRKFHGLVVKDRMNKTVLVQVDRKVRHPVYEKQYTVSKKYKVHDEKGEFHVGDVIEFIECRPISKTKRWRALRKI